MKMLPTYTGLTITLPTGVTHSISNKTLKIGLLGGL